MKRINVALETENHLFLQKYTEHYELNQDDAINKIIKEYKQDYEY